MIIDELLKDPFSFLAYLFVLSAIVSLWLPIKRRVWPWLLLVGVSVGSFTGRLELEAIAAISVLIVCFLISFKSEQSKLIRIAASVIGTLLSLVFMLHISPGFNNWQLVDDLQFNNVSASFAFYLNFDKPLVGLVLLAFGPSLLVSWSLWKNAFKPILPVLLFAPLIIYGLSYLAGLLTIDAKLPAVTLLWMLNNLLVTCVAEEAFFRGFLQRCLQNSLQRYRYGGVLSLAIVSILFGMAHFPGGLSYVFIATVAGLFYGYVYQKTAAIETSIALHFLVNFGHFIFFSYPQLV